MPMLAQQQRTQRIERDHIVRDVVEDRENHFSVATSVYRDEALFRLELERIFYANWVYLGHESEVANPGDFKSTWIGLQPVILVRDDSGQIRAFLNFCRHRGAALCRTEYGHVKSFVCPYHAWTYRTNGELVGITDRGRYPDNFTTADKGLIPVARVSSYRGLIFGALSPNVCDLVDSLGEAREQVDLWLDRALDSGYRICSPHKYSYAGNWKLQSENVIDGYHPLIVHRSAFRTFRKFAEGDYQTTFAGSVHKKGCTRGYPQGHSAIEFGFAAAFEGAKPDSVASYVNALNRRHGKERAERVLMTQYVFVFPNLALMDVNIRVIQPISHCQTEIYSYYLHINDLPDDLNQIRLRDVQTRLGTAGLVGLDDVEIFAATQTGLSACGADRILLSRGLGKERATPTGTRIGEYSDEVPQRAFWRKWRQLMEADEAHP